VTGRGDVCSLWDTTSWQIRQPEGQWFGPISSLTFGPDGKTLLIGSACAPGRQVRVQGFGGVFDSAPLADTTEGVRFWDVAADQEVAGIPAEQTMAPPGVVAWSPDGRTVAAGGEDGAVWLWDWPRRRLQQRRFVSSNADGYARTSELFRSVLPASNPKYPHSTEGVTALAFSPDARWLVTAGSRGSVRVWGTADWQEHLALPGHDGRVEWVGFTADSGRVATSRGGLVRLWDVHNGAVSASFGAEGDAPVLCGAFAPGGSLLALGSKDGTIRLWDPADERLRARFVTHQDRVTGLAFTPDGKRLASASWDRTVRLWSLAANQEVAVLEGHAGKVQAVAFSSDGQVLASGSSTGELLLWRAQRP
jgi:WD40 repeat protein